MTSMAHRPSLFQSSAVKGPRDGEAAASVRLSLLQSGDGWSLVDPDGRLVFSAKGFGGRRACLEFAQAKGVLAILG